MLLLLWSMILLFTIMNNMIVIVYSYTDTSYGTYYIMSNAMIILANSWSYTNYIYDHSNIDSISILTKIVLSNASSLILIV